MDWDRLSKQYASRFNDQASSGGSSGYSSGSGSSKKTGGIDWGSLASNYASASESRKIMEEERRAAQEEARLKREEEQAKANEKSGVDQFFGGVNDFIGSTAQAIAEPYKRVGEGAALVLGEITGQNQQIRDDQARQDEEDLRAIRAYGELIKNGTPEQKERARQGLRDLAQRADQRTAGFQQEQARVADVADPVKGAASVAQIGLDVISGGTAGSLLRGGKVAQNVGRVIAPTGIKQGAASGAIAGGLYGITGTAIDKGSEANIGDYALNTAIGTGAGGVIGAAIPAVGQVIRNAGQAFGGTKTQTNEVVQTINRGTGEKTFYRIPSGRRDDIVNQIDNNRGKKGATAGKEIDGVVTHVTARSPQEMAKRGFVDGGVFGGVKMTPMQKLDEAVSLAGKRAADKFYATTPGQKVKEVITTAQTKLQNSAAPIYRQLNEFQASGRLTENQVKNVKSLIQTSRFSAQSQAADFLAKDVDANVLTAPLNGKTLGGNAKQNLSDYINARNELNLIDIDKKRGVKINPAREAAFRKQVAELGTPEFEARFDADVNLNRKLTDLLVEEGIVSPQQRDAWRANNTEYIRVQRILEGQSEIRGGQGTGARVSRGSTIASQKRKGSTRQAADAIETAVDRTNRVWAEIASNRAANAYIDALTEAGAIGKQLRSAENVAARQDLRDALRFSRPLKNQLQRFEKSQLQYVKRIQNELNKLNKAGLAESLARPIPDETLAGKLADPGAKMTRRELQSVLDNIVQNTDTRLLRSIRKQIAKREPKLATAIDELTDIQDRLKGINAERLNQYNEAAKLADEQVRGRPTIQRFKNGIKEVYETTPEIEAAAKGFGPVYMGTLGKVISSPVRFLQSTITGGLNPAWAAIAIPRDFVEGFVLSRRAAQTHNPANVLAAAFEAAGIKKDDQKLFDTFMATERNSSSIIDLTKGAKDNARTIRELSRQQMPPFQKAISIIKSPRDWYETIQNASKWNEFAAKFQNFRGNYNKLINDGVNPDEAMNIALYEARNATGNLLEKGDWTKALAAVYPYFNPAIQGGASLAKAFRDRPVSTSAKILTGIQIPAMIATAWNMSDPRRAEAYLDISPEERERYTIMVLPGSEKTDGKWQVVKIPKAPGVGNFANPIERMMIGMYGEDPGRVEKEWQSLVKAFGSPIDPGSVNQAIGSAIPFQLKPLAEGVSNFDFYSGKQIVPDWLKEQNPNEPYKQAFDNTSATAKKIGQALGISPLLVTNFLSDTTGEFGRNALWLSDVAQDITGTGEGVGGRSPVESVTRAYSGAYGGERKREASEQLNDIFNRKTSVSSDITEALASRDLTTANKLANEYNDQITALQQFIKENRRTVDLTDKQIKALEGNRFPVVDGRLSQSSINSRLKALQSK